MLAAGGCVGSEGVLRSIGTLESSGFKPRATKFTPFIFVSADVLSISDEAMVGTSTGIPKPTREVAEVPELSTSASTATSTSIA